MALFSKRNPQRHFSGADFTVTGTIYAAPPFSALPEVYQDASRHRWAVRQPGSEPVVFGYADIIGCTVVELGEKTPGAAERAADPDSRAGLVSSVLKAPRAVSQANSAKAGIIGGVGVRVTVQTPNGSAGLDLPVMVRDIKRGCRLHSQAVIAAEQLKGRFDEMARQGR